MNAITRIPDCPGYNPELEQKCAGREPVEHLRTGDLDESVAHWWQCNDCCFIFGTDALGNVDPDYFEEAPE